MLIITHINPDPDAVCAIWLLKRFEKEAEEASVEFVPAGQTFQSQAVDSDPNILHVDTGLGKFDHHDTADRTCASQKVLTFLKEANPNLKDAEILERLVEIVTQDDHFENCCWPEPDSDRYEFFLTAILDGLKRSGKADDQELVDFGLWCLDGIFASLKLKAEAEAEIKGKGEEFSTLWGKALVVGTKNDEVLKLALKRGYCLVVRKDPDGMVKIKAHPKSRVNLTGVHKVLEQLDPTATWYLHPSRKMLLNGSYSNPEMVPSRLSLSKVVAVVKQQSGQKGKHETFIN